MHYFIKNLVWTNRIGTNVWYRNDFTGRVQTLLEAGIYDESDKDEPWLIEQLSKGNIELVPITLEMAEKVEREIQEAANKQKDEFFKRVKISKKGIVREISKDHLIKILSKLLELDGTDYWTGLIRVKEAFDLNNIGIEDFADMTEETLAKIADEIVRYIENKEIKNKLKEHR